jgi:hypothetical protein
MHTGFYWGNILENIHLEDWEVDVRIMLRWISER